MLSTSISRQGICYHILPSKDVKDVIPTILQVTNIIGTGLSSLCWDKLKGCGQFVIEIFDPKNRADVWRDPQTTAKPSSSTVQ